MASPYRRSPVQRTLIIAGMLIVLAGLLWPWLSRLPLFRLPGDLLVDRPPFRVFFPFTTMVLTSLIVSLVLWLLRR